MKSGNKQAFEFIYNKEINRLFNYASKFTNDESLIEDCIHDIFIYIWNSREKLNDVDNISPYLFVSLRHKIINTLKKQQKIEHKEINDSFLEKEPSIEMKIIGEEFNAELKSNLKESFNELSSRQKEAIFLRYYDHMDYSEICDIMDINNQSVRNLISKGIKKLSLILNKKK